MSPDELGEVFDEERRGFAAYFPHARDTYLVLLDQPCSRPISQCRIRDVAYANVDHLEIAVLTRALDFPYENLVALLRHEFGHICDDQIKFPWREMRADWIAEMVRGDRIYYDENDIQTIGPGRWPRPSYLHQ